MTDSSRQAGNMQKTFLFFKLSKYKTFLKELCQQNEFIEVKEAFHSQTSSVFLDIHIHLRF